MNSDPSSRPPVLRTLSGGVLMGLANLVPGISGGTMILAVGLYDRFVGSIADVTRLRLRRPSLMFLALLGLAVGCTIVGLSRFAVDLVNDHRWIMYSLFVGLTLGGVPELWRRSRPAGPGVVLAILAGIGVMVAVAYALSGTQLPETLPVLVLVGAAGASSMILPGISGSYVLLILGMYDRIIGSLSLSAWREDMAGSARIVLPVVVGAALGMALLSNVLKVFLERAPRLSHGALLGLLLGSVIGLWPFQQPVDPTLAHRPTRKAVTALATGVDAETIRAKFGAEFDDARLAALRESYAGLGAGELKTKADEFQRFTPTGKQIGIALGLLVVGFVLTLLLGSREAKSEGA